VQLRLHAECGTPHQAPAPETLLSAARGSGFPDLIALALAAVAQLLVVQRQTEQARALLHELGKPDVGSDYASVLPSLLRIALGLDDSPLAQRLATGVEPFTPLHAHALASARAQLAEAAGDLPAAAELYKEAAERWRAFGNVPERAYALLGQGRCLAALGKPGAEEPLRKAKELFTSMGYKPALAETKALLGETAAAAS
jgi:hypothetical protein